MRKEQAIEEKNGSDSRKRELRIRDFIEALAGELTGSSGDGSRPVSGITYNSKEAGEGSLFVCKGAGFREEYLAEAISGGACCYVKEGAGASGTVDGSSPAGASGTAGGRAEEDCAAIFVKDIRKAMPLIAETFYGKLSDEIKMVGITGTKGKSTTCYFTRNILDDYYRSRGGQGCALVSGIDIDDGAMREEASLTTPEIIDLYRHMDNAAASGKESLAMEVSSQALKYDRVSGITFEAGAFLNIGNDHISDMEHPDFDDYLDSKLLLFRCCRKACYSLDSEEQERIAEAAKLCPQVITFSRNDERADVYGYDIRSDHGRVSMRIRCRGTGGCAGFDEAFTLGTFGTINADNALAAAAISVLLGAGPENIRRGLAATTVPGRMELFRSEDGRRLAIVDFAHNELSFEKFFETIKEEFPGKKIISVFGATGSKGTNRRTGMGRVAGRCSDYSVITEDDPGNEDVNEICAQIAACIEAEGGRCEIITSRPEAVKRAIGLMDDDTILFVAGRGREHMQKRGDSYFEEPSDAELVSRYL